MQPITEAMFLQKSNEMLEKLYSYIETLSATNEIEIDFEDGVLSFCIEKTSSHFVINSNFASKKIWYSSPVSKPKYYELHPSDQWVETTLKTNIQNDLSEDIKKLL